MMFCLKKFDKTIFICIFCCLIFSIKCFAYTDEAITAYNKGIEFTEKEKYEKAIKSFKKAIEVEPSFVDAYYNLGILQEFLGDEEEAAEKFKKILKYNPEDYEVIYRLAVISYKNGKLEKAGNYIDQLPPENPNFEKIVEFMAEQDDNILKVKSRKNSREKEITTENLSHKLNGPSFCELIQKDVSDIGSPTGIARDTCGNLYVADFKNDAIIFIGNNGQKKVIAQKGLIKGPIGLATDKYDNLYVANYESDKIVLMPASGKAPYILPVQVEKPYFIMVDDSGLLYISEQGNNSISRYKLIWKNQ